MRALEELERRFESALEGTEHQDGASRQEDRTWSGRPQCQIFQEAWIVSQMAVATLMRVAGNAEDLEVGTTVICTVPIYMVNVEVLAKFIKDSQTFLAFPPSLLTNSRTNIR
jgi:hypothetical protein